MRRTRWYCVWGAATALLAGLAAVALESPNASAQQGADKTKDVKEGKDAKNGKKPDERIKFSFGKKPWSGSQGVLQWLADQTGKPVQGPYTPSGAFSFTPPDKHPGYTLPEIMDILNRQLQSQ